MPWRSIASFVVAWAWLNAVVNLRYPAPEPPLWYLTPAVDVVVLLGVFAVLARVVRHDAVPRGADVALAMALVAIRLLRFADGIETRFHYRSFSLRTDLPLVPELVRLLRATLPAWQFWMVATATLLGVAALVFVTVRALRSVREGLSQRAHVVTYLGVVATVALVSPFVRASSQRVGAFGRSVVPRLVQELDTLLDGQRYAALTAAEIARVEARLASSPRNLAKLRGRDVIVILVESYGITLLQRAEYRARVLAAYRDSEQRLRDAGFQVASTIVDSPVYGGRSWLAQASLASGVEIADEAKYEQVRGARPRTLARVFRDAGYRTILVQPGTTRPSPAEAAFYGFDTYYGASDFGYRGPTFGWAAMPDQYVLDAVRRRELTLTSKPSFVQFALVSSHAPWDVLPPVVSDWRALGDGSIFQRLPTRRFAVSWLALDRASEAYLASISYDLAVVTQYVTSFVRGEALVLVLGDHQPPPDLTGHSPDRGVPLHVISKSYEMFDSFVSRGYARGMQPAPGKHRMSLHELMPVLVGDFSVGAGGSP